MNPTAAYVARGIVRAGSRASARYNAVDSKPMNAAKQIPSTAITPPWKKLSGLNDANPSPVAPPSRRMAMPMIRRIPASRVMRTASTFAPTSIPRAPRMWTSTTAIAEITHQGVVTPKRTSSAAWVWIPKSP
jgi:hypothetical protein